MEKDKDVLKAPKRRWKPQALDISYRPDLDVKCSQDALSRLFEDINRLLNGKKRADARGYTDAMLKASGLKVNKKGKPVFPFLFSCGHCFDREMRRLVKSMDDDIKTLSKPGEIYAIEVYICEKGKDDPRLRAEGLYYLCLYFLLRGMLLAYNDETVDKYLRCRRQLEDTGIRYAKKRGKYLDEIIDTESKIYANDEKWKIGRMVRAAWRERSVTQFGVRDPDPVEYDYSYSSSSSSYSSSSDSSSVEHDYRDEYGNVVASSKDGEVYDNDGTRIGYVDGDRIYDADRNYVGTFDSDGKLHRDW